LKYRIPIGLKLFCRDVSALQPNSRVYKVTDATSISLDRTVSASSGQYPPGRPACELRSLHSLQANGRTREPHVEAQVRAILHAPSTEFWRRAAVRDRASADFIEEESLVCILRIWERGGNHAAADAIAELLIERSARKIARQIACWRLHPQHADDCTADVQAILIEAIYSDSRSYEFWEVRFWVCLERRINSAAARYRTVMDRELDMPAWEDDEGNLTDPIDRCAAPTAMSAHDRVEISEALALLTANQRIAFVLYNGEQWSQQEIAAHLNVSDRTVRNLLTTAHQKLNPWRAEGIH